MKRPLYLHLVTVAGFILAALVACAPSPPLQVGSHVWPGYEFMFLARHEGWLSPGQVELIETRTASESLQALQEGRIEAAALTLDEVLLARASGVPLSIVLVFNISAGADKLLVRPGINTLDELRGRRVGVETTAVGALVLSQALASAGLTITDVVVVPIEGPHRDAWDTYELDALVTYEPTASQLMLEGADNVYDSASMPDSIFDVLVVRQDVLKRKGNQVEALIAAHFRGLYAMRHSPQDTAYRLASRLQLPGDHVLTAYRGLVLPDLAGNRALLGAEEGRLIGAAAKLVAWMTANGRLPAAVTVDELVTAEYLRGVATP